MGKTYEVLLGTPKPSGKRKVELRKFLRNGDMVKERRVSCEVDAGEVKPTPPDFEIVHLKETDDLIDCVMTLRHLGLDSCADEVEKWYDEDKR